MMTVRYTGTFILAMQRGVVAALLADGKDTVEIKRRLQKWYAQCPRPVCSRGSPLYSARVFWEGKRTILCGEGVGRYSRKMITMDKPGMGRAGVSMSRRGVF